MSHLSTEQLSTEQQPAELKPTEQRRPPAFSGQLSSSTTSRSGTDRLRMALGFEGIGLLLLIPVSSWFLDKPALELGGLAVLMSLLATWWNYQFNQWFDRYYLAPRGRNIKTQPERIVHAICFELGLLAVFLPLTAWYLAISLWQALLLDLSFMLFYLLYGYFYHWAYDLLFPPPVSTTATASENMQKAGS